ncbi:MAG: hypothetical protein RRZ83_04880 [Alistipes sp.]
MNRKTFSVAVFFFCLTFVWLVVNVWWALAHRNTTADLVIAVVFFVAGIGMIYNEVNKKKRKHISDVDKHKIP